MDKGALRIAAIPLSRAAEGNDGSDVGLLELQFNALVRPAALVAPRSRFEVRLAGRWNHGLAIRELQQNREYHVLTRQNVTLHHQKPISSHVPVPRVSDEKRFVCPEVFLFGVRRSRVRRNIEGEDSQYDLAIAVVWLSENIAEHGFAGCATIAFEERVFCYGFKDLCKDGAEVSVSIKHKHGCLCVPPAQVGEELVECSK